MDRTACTEPQCPYRGDHYLYLLNWRQGRDYYYYYYYYYYNKGRAIPLLPLWTVRPVQSLSACTGVTFTFTCYTDAKEQRLLFLLLRHYQPCVEPHNSSNVFQKFHYFTCSSAKNGVWADGRMSRKESLHDTPTTQHRRSRAHVTDMYDISSHIDISISWWTPLTLQYKANTHCISPTFRSQRQHAYWRLQSQSICPSTSLAYFSLQNWNKQAPAITMLSGRVAVSPAIWTSEPANPLSRSLVKNSRSLQELAKARIL